MLLRAATGSLPHWVSGLVTLAAALMACPAPADPPEADRAPPSALPALEIVGFDVLVNRFADEVLGYSGYDVSLSSIEDNLTSKWITKEDPFAINQLGHPYQGSMYHGFARSTGHGFWPSFGYAFGGSVLWEIAGETTTPQTNDQIATGIGGPLLGEALFRMASLVLEGAHGRTGFWREAAAAAISPATGFNRLVFDNRFDSIFASHHPAYYMRLQLGSGGTTENEPGTVTELDRFEGLADFAIDYGLPGKRGYHYTRPFDYFSFRSIVTSAGGFETVAARGLLLGTDYTLGPNYRAVWGLYGSYDYFEPQLFRISSTALSLGTTAQWWLSSSIALQGTALVGVGYAGARTAQDFGDKDYHYGVAPQALLTLRLLLGDRAALEFTGRDYLVTALAAKSRGGSENVVRTDLTLTWRVHGRHAIAVRYLWSRRDASLSSLGHRTQERGAIGVYYTLLGGEGFGAVEWR